MPSYPLIRSEDVPRNTGCLDMLHTLDVQATKVSLNTVLAQDSNDTSFKLLHIRLTL